MQLSCEFDTVGTRRVVVVCVVVAVAAMLVGVASAQSAQSGPTGIDSCTTINSSGKYVLTTDITSGTTASEEGCIEITASNVVLDGRGHLLAGDGSGHGVEVNGPSRAVTNVTVQRLQAANWSIGIFYLSADNGTVRGTITNNTTEGIALAASSGNRLVENTGYDNAIAIAVGGESQNNTLRENLAVENKWGFHFERDSANNTVVNNTARNNTKWGYYSLRNGGTNTVRDLHLATATVSFTGQNVALRSVRSPPALPRGTRSLGTFVETIATGGSEPSELSLTMRYDAPNGSAVSLWHNNGQYWSRVRSAQVNQRANTITTNLTEFGVFAPLARDRGSTGGPVTVTPDDSVAVQRTLTTVAPTQTSTPVTATPTRNRSGGRTNGSAVTPSASTPPPSATSTTIKTEQSRPARDMATTVGPARGESDATTSTFSLGPIRLFFVLLGLVGLVALGLVALRERR